MSTRRAGATSPRAAADATASRPHLLLFLTLAFALSWWPWPLYLTGRLPLPIASFGPFLAAVAVLCLGPRRGAVRDLLRSMVTWRVRPLAWALAVLTPVVLTGAAVAVNLLLGAEPAEGPSWSSAAQLPVAFLAALLVPGFGGAWEEPGWRGYALPRLQERWGFARAAIALGVVGAAWHLPLILAGLDSWWDVPLLLGVNVVIARIFGLSGGSVLLMMVLHATNNAFSGGFVTPMFDGPDAGRQAALVALVWLVAAGLVLARPASSRVNTSRHGDVPPDMPPAATDAATWREGTR
jgi:membrane protease YdiL (CAAX protease family)